MNAIWYNIKSNQKTPHHDKRNTAANKIYSRVGSSRDKLVPSARLYDIFIASIAI